MKLSELHLSRYCLARPKDKKQPIYSVGLHSEDGKKWTHAAVGLPHARRVYPIQIDGAGWPYLTVAGEKIYLYD